MKFYIIYCVQICFCVQSIVKARLDQPMIALKNLIRLASAPAMQNTDWHLIMPYIKNRRILHGSGDFLYSDMLLTALLLWIKSRFCSSGRSRPSVPPGFMM